MDQTCPICDDTVKGYHYGAMTCESCKAFFKRCADKDEPERCKENTYTCIISKSTRNACRGCRFLKCLNCGMDPKKVKGFNNMACINQFYEQIPHSRSNINQKEDIISSKSGSEDELDDDQKFSIREWDIFKTIEYVSDSIGNAYESFFINSRIFEFRLTQQRLIIDLCMESFQYIRSIHSTLIHSLAQGYLVREVGILHFQQILVRLSPQIFIYLVSMMHNNSKNNVSKNCLEGLLDLDKNGYRNLTNFAESIRELELSKREIGPMILTSVFEDMKEEKYMCQNMYSGIFTVVEEMSIFRRKTLIKNSNLDQQIMLNMGFCIDSYFNSIKIGMNILENHAERIQYQIMSQTEPLEKCENIFGEKDCKKQAVLSEKCLSCKDIETKKMLEGMKKLLMIYDEL